MSYLTNEEMQAINRYFEPERRKIPQLQQKIEQLQKGGGIGSGDVAGGVTNAMFQGTGMLIKMFGMGFVGDVVSGTGKVISKGVKSGGQALDNSANNAEIQRIYAEIQKIQSGNVDRGISDTYMDTIVENLVPDDLYEKALDALMIDESQIKAVQPVNLEDYFFDETNENQLIARGRDGHNRTPLYQATLLFGTDKQLCVYQYTFDMETDTYRETAKKYFWKNITELAKTTEIINGNRKNIFVIKVSNGEYRCVYKDSPEIKRSINAMSAYYDLKNE